MSYQSQYQQSLEEPERFWRQQAERIAWFKKPNTILSKTESGLDQWYSDGELNTAWLALDYHLDQGRGDQIALQYDSPVTGQKQAFSYAELTQLVARFAGVLRQQGVTKGDRVVIYMPMVPQAVIAMLACARLGAIHSVVFGGFAAHELAVRIDDAKPKVVVSASCGVEVDKVIPYKPLLDKALELSQHQPGSSIIFQRPQWLAELQQGRDVDWDAQMALAQPAEPVSLKATDPLYILYTSGTTGKPKGVVRDNGGHAVAMQYSMEAIYGMQPGEVFWAASDVGWVVGHSYIVYGPLLAGCTTILYEGKPVKTPDAAAFWRVCDEYNVKALFSAPTAFRAIRKEDPEALGLKPYKLAALERLYLAGERLDPPTYHWLEQHTQRPIIDHWWQTETGWAIAGNPVGIEMKAVKPGSSSVPTPGFDIQILDAAGCQVATNEQGNVALKLPLPPGCLSTIWQDETRFKSAYLKVFEGYYASGDGGYIDEDGYVFIMGRTDDVINVAGHRLSTGEMEEIVGGHPAIAECAVVGVSDELKGQLPIGLVMLKDGVNPDEGVLEQELVGRVREQLGPLACFKKAIVVDRLPKTRSGKILRKLIRQIADGEAFSIPSTIDDPAIPDEIQARFAALGLV